MNLGMKIILILSIGILIHEIICIRELLIASKKNSEKIIFTLVGIIVIIVITYIYADIWIHYIFGVVAATIFGLSLFKSGLNSRGFNYTSLYMGFILPWQEVKRVELKVEDDIIVQFTGEESNELHFKKEQYKELIYILKENLSSNVLKEN